MLESSNNTFFVRDKFITTASPVLKSFTGKLEYFVNRDQLLLLQGTLLFFWMDFRQLYVIWNIQIRLINSKIFIVDCECFNKLYSETWIWIFSWILLSQFFETQSFLANVFRLDKLCWWISWILTIISLWFLASFLL